MIVGGIILKDVDKNLRNILLLMGLILLIIYSIASPSLQWSLPSYAHDETGFGSRPTGYGIPGFEFLIVIGAMLAILLVKRKMKS
jgi:hypothetical protein